MAGLLSLFVTPPPVPDIPLPPGANLFGLRRALGAVAEFMYWEGVRDGAALGAVAVLALVVSVVLASRFARGAATRGAYRAL